MMVSDMNASLVSRALRHGKARQAATTSHIPRDKCEDDKMKFTRWQIEKIRRSLNAYRVQKRVGRAPLSWRVVLDLILLAKSTKHVHSEYGHEEGPFKQEALRRFANGLEVLQPDKLEDVRRFLLEEGMLRPGELEDVGDLTLSHLLTKYSAVNVGSFEEEHVELRFLPETTSNLVAVEEHVRLVQTHGDISGRDRGRLGTTIRRGYAFTSSPSATLHVFVRGGDLDDHVHYVGVANPMGSREQFVLPLLLRSGPLSRVTRRDARESAEALKLAGLSCYLPEMEDEQIARAMSAFNILAFSPSPGAREVQPARPSAVAVSAGVAQEGELATVSSKAADEARASGFDAWWKGTQLREMVQQLAAEHAAALIAEGADVNVPDHNGMTALHHAAARGARPCIRLLVASGKCDYLLRDGRGRYAFELAIEWARDYAVARLLMTKQVQQADRQGVPAYVPRAASQP
jgi:hypothetical protein